MPLIGTRKGMCKGPEAGTSLGSTKSRKQVVWLECLEWLGEWRKALRGQQGLGRLCLWDWAEVWILS